MVTETLHMRVGPLIGEHLLDIAQTNILNGNINYCIENDIVSYHIPYGGRPSIDNAKTCNPPMPGLSKNTYIEEEPLSYPCIFCIYFGY